jgi:uncharacterized protein (DUF924 family)
VTSEAEAVLRFWLDDASRSPDHATARNAVWFGRDPGLDAEICERFGTRVEAARTGDLDEWLETPRELLAWVILVDQFSRNVYRDSAAAFEADPRARAAALRALSLGWDRELAPIERVFLYLPLEHSEALVDQDRCVALCAALGAEVAEEWKPIFENYSQYARKHREVIARFGRFPHRNRVLGRPDTDEEREYLSAGGGFG